VYLLVIYIFVYLINVRQTERIGIFFLFFFSPSLTILSISLIWPLCSLPVWPFCPSLSSDHFVLSQSDHSLLSLSVWPFCLSVSLSLSQSNHSHPLTLAVDCYCCTWSQSHTPQSVGLLWTSDEPVAEISTWQHTTLTRGTQSCLRRDSNPQFQRASGRRPTS
jgi:hypothetical protein